MADDDGFWVTLEQQGEYQFRLSFDWQQAPAVTTDLAAPLGRQGGPDPERLLAAAVGNCLSASLLFALRKFKQTPGPLRTVARGTVARNEHGRLRVAGLDVTIRLAERADQLQHLARAASQFEEFCVVTQSIRQGVPVRVEILDADGTVVHRGG